MITPITLLIPSTNQLTLFSSQLSTPLKALLNELVNESVIVVPIEVNLLFTSSQSPEKKSPQSENIPFRLFQAVEKISEKKSPTGVNIVFIESYRSVKNEPQLENTPLMFSQAPEKSPVMASPSAITVPLTVSHRVVKNPTTGERTSFISSHASPNFSPKKASIGAKIFLMLSKRPLKNPSQLAKTPFIASQAPEKSPCIARVSAENIPLIVSPIVVRYDTMVSIFSLTNI